MFAVHSTYSDGCTIDNASYVMKKAKFQVVDEVNLNLKYLISRNRGECGVAAAQI